MREISREISNTGLIPRVLCKTFHHNRLLLKRTAPMVFGALPALFVFDPAIITQTAVATSAL
jgi:hypothetical protein